MAVWQLTHGDVVHARRLSALDRRGDTMAMPAPRSYAGAVEVWTPADQLARTERHVLTWHPAGVSTPLVIQLAELFEPI